MSNVNLYKISNDKQAEFIEKLTLKMGEPTLKEVVLNGITYIVKLYFNNNGERKLVNWSWIVSEFEMEDLFSSSNPTAIVTINIGGMIYVYTFGSSFFLADKFCDNDFAFTFARKIQYQNIKTTTLSSPNSKRNKIVNSYISNEQLEFDSGESFAKIKAKMILEEDFELYKESIEIGNSLKLNLQDNSLNNLILLIIHIEHTIESVEIDLYKIPLFKRVTDDVLLGELERRLNSQINDNVPSIQISEMEIIGVSEIFNNQDLHFELKYGRNNKVISELNMSEVNEFISEYPLNSEDTFLKIKVITHRDGISVSTNTLKNLIDYVDDENRCVLSKGEWYHFNDDYLEYLKDSINEIDCFYNEIYDFSKVLLEEYRQRKFDSDKDEEIYIGLSDQDIKKKIDRKYYTERSYNNWLEELFDFENHDRETQRLENHSIEAMDVYKDETMYAVKIGNSSSKLSYVIDQSIVSLKLYKQNLLSIPRIKNVGIWIMLERQTKLTCGENGTPNINELDMLMLKNRIDEWKKIVRLAGMNPVININYMS